MNLLAIFYTNWRGKGNFFLLKTIVQEEKSPSFSTFTDYWNYHCQTKASKTCAWSLIEKSVCKNWIIFKKKNFFLVDPWGLILARNGWNSFLNLRIKVTTTLVLGNSSRIKWLIQTVYFGWQMYNAEMSIVNNSSKRGPSLEFLLEPGPTL